MVGDRYRLQTRLTTLMLHHGTDQALALRPFRCLPRFLPGASHQPRLSVRSPRQSLCQPPPRPKPPADDSAGAFAGLGKPPSPSRDTCELATAVPIETIRDTPAPSPVPNPRVSSVPIAIVGATPAPVPDPRPAETETPVGASTSAKRWSWEPAESQARA